jgi:hypothetical protein
MITRVGLIKRYTYIALFAFSLDLNSQILQEIKPLSLGKIAIVDNGEVSTVKITKDGEARVTRGIYFLQTGQPAEFEISDSEPNRRIYITITPLQSSTVTGQVSSEQFSIVEYDHVEFIQTNSIGFASFFVGAVFATSGSDSENFLDTDFTANYQVTINY